MWVSCLTTATQETPVLLGAVEDLYRPRCGDDEETFYHYFSTCNVYKHLIQEIFGLEEIRKEELYIPWNKVMTFASSRRFEKELDKWQ